MTLPVLCKQWWWKWLLFLVLKQLRKNIFTILVITFHFSCQSHLFISQNSPQCEINTIFLSQLIKQSKHQDMRKGNNLTQSYHITYYSFIPFNIDPHVMLISFYVEFCVFFPSSCFIIDISVHVSTWVLSLLMYYFCIFPLQNTILFPLYLLFTYLILPTFDLFPLSSPKSSPA